MKNNSFRLAALIICFTFVLSVCGCVKRAESDNGYDTMGNALLYTNKLASSFYGDGVLYFKSSSFYRSFIDYYVVNDNEYGTLCARPECTHNSASCDGYAAGVKSAQLTMYGGRLYYMVQQPDTGEFQLVSRTPGGRDLKVHLKYDQTTFSGIGVKLAAICDGTLYMCGDAVEVRNGKGMKNAVLYSQRLDGGEPELLFEKEFEYPPLVKRVGNTVWFALSGKGELKLYSFDMETRELTEEITYPSERVFTEMLIVPEGFLFVDENSVWLFDTESRNLKERISFSRPEDSIFAVSDGAVFLLTDQTHYRCVDWSGKQLAEGRIAGGDGFELKESIKTPIGCIDGKIFFLAATLMSEAEPHVYFISYDPNTDEFSLIYSSKLRMDG